MHHIHQVRWSIIQVRPILLEELFEVEAGATQQNNVVQPTEDINPHGCELIQLDSVWFTLRVATAA